MQQAEHCLRTLCCRRGARHSPPEGGGGDPKLQGKAYPPVTGAVGELPDKKNKSTSLQRQRADSSAGDRILPFPK